MERPPPHQPPPPPPQGNPPTPRARMQDAVANVMQQVAEEKAARRADVQAEKEKAVRRSRRAWPLLILAGFGFVISLVYFVPRWQHPFKPPAGAAAVRDARQAILFADAQVRLYVTENGRPPVSLSETGLTLPGIAYRVTPGGYELSAVIEGRPIVLNSDDDRARFRAGLR